MKTSVVATLTSLALAGLLTACGSTPSASTERQDEVRAAGSEVMPFDLDKTKHSFVKVDDGGVQTVLALDPADTTQVSLVREHLIEIAGEFSAGNFADPVSVHGADMPGVQELSEAGDKLTVTYREVDGGAEVTYTSSDAETVEYLHQWFDAQVADHGHDAVDEPLTSGTGGNVITEEMWRVHHPGEPYPGS